MHLFLLAIRPAELKTVGLRQVLQWTKFYNCRTVSQRKRNMGSAVAQKFDTFYILDFEATCDATFPPEPQEIIEWPCLKVGRTFEIESVFHKYVLPDVHPRLTSFCTELTGIIQGMVNEEFSFLEVLAEFDNWILSNSQCKSPSTGGTVNSAFITCGDWDFATMLKSQCRYHGVKMPPYCERWINVKKAFHGACGIWPRNLIMMLDKLGLEHQGRLHSGIDDCKNILSIVRSLAAAPYSVRLELTGSIDEAKKLPTITRSPFRRSPNNSTF